MQSSVTGMYSSRAFGFRNWWGSFMHGNGVYVHDIAAMKNVNGKARCSEV